MAEKDYSLEALSKFLDFAAEKGLLKRNTAQSRKLAANKILSVLSESEKANLQSVDLDDAFERFQNLEGIKYKPDSLQVYQSRLKTALSDFFSYVENPSGFKPAGSQRSGPRKKHEKSARKGGESRSGAASDQPGSRSAGEPQSHVVVPVPLREGLTVEIRHLPVDLTAAEAARIAAIIKAYAVIEEN